MTTVYDFEALSIDGKPVALKKFQGQGHVDRQHRQCLWLSRRSLPAWRSCTKAMASKGLVVLGFPCNQFGAQDAGSNGEIAEFCQLNYGVTFPMMAKIEVNGAGRPPAVPVAGSRGARPAGQQIDQVELHQVSGRQGRPGAASAMRRPTRPRACAKTLKPLWRLDPNCRIKKPVLVTGFLPWMQQIKCWGLPGRPQYLQGFDWSSWRDRPSHPYCR